MVIALQTVFDRRWLLELNIRTSSMWWSWFLQTKLIIYSLLKSANRLKDIHSHLSRQIKGHNGFRKGFPTYPKGFLKASTSAKEKKIKKRKKKKNEPCRLNPYFQRNITDCYILKFSTLWELSFSPKRQKLPILLK